MTSCVSCEFSGQISRSKGSVVQRVHGHELSLMSQHLRGLRSAFSTSSNWVMAALFNLKSPLQTSAKRGFHLSSLHPHQSTEKVFPAARVAFGNLENSAVATGLEKVNFHSNSKERQCQRMFKLLHNCTHLTR